MLPDRAELFPRQQFFKAGIIGSSSRSISRWAVTLVKDVVAPHCVDENGRARSIHETMRSFRWSVSLELPSLEVALDFHYNLNEYFNPSYRKTFLKKKKQVKYSESWIGRNDSALLKNSKISYILHLLQSVDYECEGFFRELIEFLELQTKSQQLPNEDVLNEEEDGKYGYFDRWKNYANQAFGILDYPEEK
jgi:hypothetical protein